jgi:hypothetical protein
MAMKPIKEILPNVFDFIVFCAFLCFEFDLFGWCITRRIHINWPGNTMQVCGCSPFWCSKGYRGLILPPIFQMNIANYGDFTPVKNRLVSCPGQGLSLRAWRERLPAHPKFAGPSIHQILVTMTELSAGGLLARNPTFQQSTLCFFRPGFSSLMNS